MTQPPKHCTNRKCPLGDTLPENLREAAHRLSILDFALDQVRESIFLLDGEARFIQVNGEACRALEYSREELLGMAVFDIDPDFTREHWRALEPRRQSEGLFTIQARHRRKSGRIFPVEVRVRQFLFQNEHYTLCLSRDISEERQTAQLKRRYREEFHVLVENSPDTIARYDRNCIRIYANPALVARSGKPVIALLGKRPSEGTGSLSLRTYEARMRQVIETGVGCEVELEWMGSHGHLVNSLVRLTPELDEHGRTAGVIAVGRDVSALKKTQRRLELAEAQAHIGHWEWDYLREESLLSAEVCRIFERPLGWRPHVNEVLAEIIDEDRDRVIGVLHEAYRQGIPEVSYGYRLRRANGEIAHLHSTVLVEYDPESGNPLRLVGTTQDITELKNYECHLHDLAVTDTLTKLPNRAFLIDRARQAMAAAAENGKAMGLMLVDLDRFKEVNDTFGHAVGDQILIEFGQRLRGVLRDYDTVARLSGDEFAVVLPEIRRPTDLERVAEKIFAGLGGPFRHRDSEIFVTMSIGIAMFPDHADDVAALLQYADAALGDAKEHGRACRRFYTADLTEKSRERLLIEGGLRHAMARQELQLHYQPQVDLAGGRLVGAEALMRWHHPSLGQVPPDRFIPVAEDSGLILGMGEWALATAFTQAACWNERRSEPFRMAVNLSSRQFGNGNLAEVISTIAEKTRCLPAWIELEITESVLLEDSEKVRRTLEKLALAGFSIAIDDFGTGYSALGYLHRFPIQTIKIDRSFVRRITGDRNSAELVKAILSMAHALNLSVVAEGIEHPSEEAFLRAHGSHFGQGYFYGRPVEAEHFESLLLSPMLPKT